MQVLLFSTFLVAALVAAVAWHRKRWLAAHAGDARATNTPVIAAFSPLTGNAIPTGTEPLADVSHADGADACQIGEAAGHDGTNY